MNYFPVQDVNTGEVMYWIDENDQAYPENPDHVAAQVAEYEAYVLANMSDEELADYIQDSEERYGEIDSQYRSECSLYGDAWPGAAVQRDKAYEMLQILNREWARRHPEVNDPEAMAEAHEMLGGDIPF